MPHIRTEVRNQRSAVQFAFDGTQFKGHLQRNFGRETVYDSRRVQPSPVCRRDPSFLYACFELVIRNRNDSKRYACVASCCIVPTIERYVESSVEVEEEFELMLGLAGEDILDRPVAFTLVECDDAAMSHRLCE